MSQLASIRQQRQPWGRGALGLFVVVWLNLALQPCAMAFAADEDHDCPHCPPAQTHEHDGMHVGTQHDMPCADSVADCATADDWNHDGRGGQSKLKDTPTDLLVAIAPHELAAAFRQATDARLVPRQASVHAGTSPPLHVLNCVYLK